MSTETLNDLLLTRRLIVEPKTSMNWPSTGPHRSSRRARTGTVEPHHTHPGVEILYGVAGRGEVELDGRTRLPSGRRRPSIERGHVKSLRNAGDALAVLAVLVLDADKPPLLPASGAETLRRPKEQSGTDRAGKDRTAMADDPAATVASGRLGASGALSRRGRPRLRSWSAQPSFAGRRRPTGCRPSPRRCCSPLWSS